MKRYEHTHHLRFLTFSTYRRLPLFGNARIKDLFAACLARAKVEFQFHLYAWVVMPEHIHLLLWPRLPEFPVAAVLHDFKGGFGEKVIGRWRELQAPILERITTPRGLPRFWQTGGGYDRNIWSPREFAEKIRYTHLNPVKRGLCGAPEDWAWSSARWYAGDRRGPVPIDALPPRRPGARVGENVETGGS